MTNLPSPVLTDELAAQSLADQPIKRVIRDQVEYVLLGTAHVSRASVAAVRELLHTETFDAVAIELCESRYKTMRNPDSLYQLDLFQVIRGGKAGLVAANLALASFQRRLAEQFGVEPGAEMKTAMEIGESKQILVWRIDREISLTLKRAYRAVGFWDRLGIVGGLITSLFSSEQVSEDDVEKLKHGDVLSSMFDEFAQQSEPLYRSVIAERDSFMTARLRQESANQPVQRVLVVIGAGHLAGIERELQQQHAEPATELALLNEAPAAARWPKWIGIGVLLIIAAAIGIAYSRGAQLGAVALQNWILFTSTGAAMGALVGGGHPFSILAAAIAGPLKPFRLFIPAGAISAGVEMWWYRPRVADFETLRQDVAHWTGWWKNRVTRTLLVFLFTNFGVIIGEYLAGIRIIKSLL